MTPGSPETRVAEVLPGARASMMLWWWCRVWMREASETCEGIEVLTDVVAIVVGCVDVFS